MLARSAGAPRRTDVARPGAARSHGRYHRRGLLHGDERAAPRVRLGHAVYPRLGGPPQARPPARAPEALRDAARRGADHGNGHPPNGRDRVADRRRTRSGRHRSQLRLPHADRRGERRRRRAAAASPVDARRPDRPAGRVPGRGHQREDARRPRVGHRVAAYLRGDCRRAAGLRHRALPDRARGVPARARRAPAPGARPRAAAAATCSGSARPPACSRWRPWTA